MNGKGKDLDQILDATLDQIRGSRLEPAEEKAAADRVWNLNEKRPSWRRRGLAILIVLIISGLLLAGWQFLSLFGLDEIGDIVDHILLDFNDDVASLRRGLIEHKLMSRSQGIYRKVM